MQEGSIINVIRNSSLQLNHSAHSREAQIPACLIQLCKSSEIMLPLHTWGIFSSYHTATGRFRVTSVQMAMLTAGQLLWPTGPMAVGVLSA